jgi:hypothetical protein
MGEQLIGIGGVGAVVLFIAYGVTQLEALAAAAFACLVLCMVGLMTE